MVHVHQVLVHERVVALHRAAEAARLVALVACGAEVGELSRSSASSGSPGNTKMSPPASRHGYERTPFGSRSRAEIGNVDAAAGAVVGPAVIAAADRFAVDDARMQRHLPVRAAVLEREHAARVRAHEHDRVAGEGASERLAALQLARPRERIPVIGMDIDPAKIGV